MKNIFNLKRDYPIEHPDNTDICHILAKIAGHDINGIFTTVICLLLICNISFALSFTQSDLKLQNLKGCVKSVKTYNVAKQAYIHTDTIAKYKSIEKPIPEYKRTLEKVEEFNRRGLRTLNEDVNWSKEVISFDSLNNKTFVFTSEIRFDSDGKLSRIYEQILDEDGFPELGSAVDGEGNIIFIETYIKTIRPDGKIDLESEHDGSNGNTTKICLTLRPDYSFERLLQKAPKFIQDIHMDEQERPTFLYENNNGIETIITMEYTPDGNNGYKLDEKGQKQLYQVKKKDTYGNQISAVQFGPTGEVEESITSTYIYDEQGNWIRREERSNDSLEIEITEREIEYYL